MISVPEVFNYWLQPGRIDVGFLGGAQIDRFANINSTVIGDYATPKVRLPGAGGAPEIAASCREVFVLLRQTPRAFVERVDFVSSMGFGEGPGDRAAARPARRGPAGGRHRHRHPAAGSRDVRADADRAPPGATVEQARAATGWDLAVADDLETIAAADDRPSWRRCGGCRTRERTRPRSRSSAPDRPDWCCPTCSRRGGIDCVVLEQRDRDYVEHRVRAGVLEHPTVELLRRLGLAERLDRQGLPHRGIELAFEGRRHRIDFLDLTGRSITVYGQQEVVKDLIAARLAAGGEIVFEALDVDPADVDTDRPVVRYLHDGERHELRCRIVAGCDGFHGVCRDLVPGLGGGRAGVPVRLARDPRRGGPDDRRADLRQPRPRLRPVQHALADDHPPVPPGPGRRAARGLVRRPHLGRAAHPPADRGRLHASTPARSSRRASRRCAASSPRRCATATCCSPATPPTSCRRPGPRG